MITTKKVGGLRFVRIGRLQVSYCICKARPKAIRETRKPSLGELGSDLILATLALAAILVS